MKNTSKAVVISLLTLFSCSSQKEIKPIIHDIEELVFASGQLEWDDMYSLSAQTDGILNDVNFEIGNSITKGTKLASIVNKNNDVNIIISEQQLQIANQNLLENSPSLMQIKQNIEFADAKYHQDKIQLERFEKLYTTKSIAKVELENVQLNAKNSLSNLNNLKKQYDQQIIIAKQQQIALNGQVLNNKVIQNFNSIVALENGTVIKKFKNNGDYVKKGDIIASIANSNKVKAVLNIDETSISKIKVNQVVYVQLNTNKNKIYQGNITEILSAFDNQTQSFICKVILNEKVKANLYGTQLEANILVGRKKNALLIPRNYLGYRNKVNVKGRENEIDVITGIISTEYVEILSGLNKNDVLLPLKLK